MDTWASTATPVIKHSPVGSLLACAWAGRKKSEPSIYLIATILYTMKAHSSSGILSHWKRPEHHVDIHSLQNKSAW